MTVPILEGGDVVRAIDGVRLVQEDDVALAQSVVSVSNPIDGQDDLDRRHARRRAARAERSR